MRFCLQTVALWCYTCTFAVMPGCRETHSALLVQLFKMLLFWTSQSCIGSATDIERFVQSVIYFFSWFSPGIQCFFRQHLKQVKSKATTKLFSEWLCHFKSAVTSFTWIRVNSQSIVILLRQIHFPLMLWKYCFFMPHIAFV